MLSIVRTTLGLFLFLVGCSSDKFTNGDASTEGSAGDGATNPCAKHDLCDNFDMTGEIAGGPPWTTRTQNLSIVPNGFSKPSCLQAAATLSTFVTWALPKVGGITCTAMLSFDDAMDRGRTVAGIDVDYVGDGGTMMTRTYTVSLEQAKVIGYIGTKGTLMFDTWGSSGTAATPGMWIPFKIDATFGNPNFTISGQVGTVMLQGSPVAPGVVLGARISFGAATLDNMHMDLVRWDDVICDSR
jgi:hypothetical protein